MNSEMSPPFVAMTAIVLAMVIASGHPERLRVGRDPRQGGEVLANVDRVGSTRRRPP